MIKATPAFGTEPCEKDNWRNRILLSVGKKSWHLSRKEAQLLSDQLTQVLEASEPEVFGGSFIHDGSDCFLHQADGTKVPLLHLDYTAQETQGQTVEVCGRLQPDKGIYVISWSIKES